MKKILQTIAASVLVMGLIAGCSSKNGDGGAASQTSSAASPAEASGNAKKIPITIAVQYWSGPKWADNHPTIQYLNEKFNIDLKLEIINGPEYGEKLKVMAASGNLPDFYRASDAATYIKWQSEGAFKDLTDLLPKYPNLNAAYPPSDAMSLLNPKDKVYGLPEISWIVRDTVQIRQDWLDNLGMQLPTAEEFTVDKFYEIAKAFAKQDPDKNGVNGDTIGFSNDNASLKFAFGIANGWTEKDGKLIPHQMQVEEYKAYLAFMKKAYDEGVLDKDFVLRSANEIHDLRKSNKLGLFTYHNGYPSEIEANVKKTFPESNPVVVPMAPPIGPNGLRANESWVVGNTKQVINAQASDEKVDRILQILDWWVTDEGTTVMKNGIEGVHYKKNADGKYEVTDKWEGDYPRFMNSNLFKRPGTDFNFYLWSDEAEIARNEAYKALVEKYPLKNAAMGLEYYSETYAKKISDLNAKFDEAVSKIIVGSAPIEYIEQASADWLANGGEQIVKEINEAANR